MEKKSASRSIVTAYLMHVSHYDPVWCGNKMFESPFEAEVALEIIERLAEFEFDYLILDLADGLEFTSHPELRRHYTVSKNILSPVLAAARRKGLKIIPKLNFSSSGRNHHDEWLYPYTRNPSWTGVVFDGEYAKVATDVICEVIDFIKPEGFFHIGMDEEHNRSYDQYVTTICRLDRLLSVHELRPVIWNDSGYDYPEGPNKIHADKCAYAESRIPKSIVQTVWNYSEPRPDVVRRLKQQGFTVWGAPGQNAEQVKHWRKALLSEGGDGLVMTNWKKCNIFNRDLLLSALDMIGKAYMQ